MYKDCSVMYKDCSVMYKDNSVMYKDNSVMYKEGEGHAYFAQLGANELCIPAPGLVFGGHGLPHCTCCWQEDQLHQ